jgi:hypothetical protein
MAEQLNWNKSNTERQTERKKTCFRFSFLCCSIHVGGERRCFLLLLLLFWSAPYTSTILRATENVGGHETFTVFDVEILHFIANWQWQNEPQTGC